MKNIRPIIVATEPGIESWQKEAVLQGIREITDIAGISDMIEITFSNKIIDYLNKGLKSGRRGQLNVDEIQNILANEIIILPTSQIYYKILILKTDMYSDGTNFVIGLAQEGIGSVISINRFLKLDHKTQTECIKTETIHELGHVFGLVPDSREIMVEDSLGKHCKNRCTMRQGLTVPDDWIRYSSERLKFGTFCNICRDDLRTFFSDK